MLARENILYTVMEYYENRGYSFEDNFMVKKLEKDNKKRRDFFMFMMKLYYYLFMIYVSYRIYLIVLTTLTNLYM